MRVCEELKNIDIRTVDKSGLTDIKDVHIDKSTPVEMRIKSFLNQVANPYCLIIDGVIVKNSFSDTGESMNDVLKRYFQGKVE